MFFLYVKTTLVNKKTFFFNFLLMKKCKIRNILCEKIITKQDVLLIKAQKNNGKVNNGILLIIGHRIIVLSIESILFFIKY